MIYIYTGVRKRALESLEYTNKLLYTLYMSQGNSLDEDSTKEQINKHEAIKDILEEILGYETT